MARPGLPEGSASPSMVTGGRVGPPTAGVSGSMYDFVRHYLVEHGGTCTRQELLAALQADDAMKERLANSSNGFTALIHNMRHSGDVLIDGNLVRASGRTFQRLGKHSR